MVAFVGALVAAVVVIAPPAPIPRRQVGWERLARGPVDARRVYWVGHSLVSSRSGPRNLIEEVGFLAERSGLSYASFDHTFWGAPLSLNWTGAARSFERAEVEALTRRRELEDRGRRYDTLVMTEAVPIRDTMRAEAGSYYAMRFYCAALAANPNMDIYVYESWLELEDERSFLEQLAADRPDWERLADEAAAARVPEPGRLARLAPYWRSVEAACEGPPIRLVPVGRVLRRLGHDRARQPEQWTWADGSEMRLAELFANAPGPDGALPHPDRDRDAIHASALGIYVAGLTHFATLYRRRPAPASDALSEATDRRLVELVWSVVTEDPRAGVRR